MSKAIKNTKYRTAYRKVEKKNQKKNQRNILTVNEVRSIKNVENARKGNLSSSFGYFKLTV